MSVLLLILAPVVTRLAADLPPGVRMVEPDDPVRDIQAQIPKDDMVPMRLSDKPRDRYNRLNKNKISAAESRSRARLWFDFVANHYHNLEKPDEPEYVPIRPNKDRKGNKNETNNTPEPRNMEDKVKHFIEGRFGPNLVMENTYNFTTCDELKKLKGSIFNPNDIKGLVWVAFYAWDVTPVLNTKFRFVHPTKKLVAKFKKKYAPYLDKAVDWNQPKMYLRQQEEEVLYIAVDRTGLFYSINNFEIPQHVIGSNITFPVTTTRFKIMDPYLVIMYCGFDSALLLSLEGEVPETESEKVDEAMTIGINGPGHVVNQTFSDIYQRKMEEVMRLTEEEKRIRSVILADREHGMFPPEVRSRLDGIWQRLDEIWQDI